MRVREKSFEGAICDEVQLADDAKKLVQTYLKNGYLPPFDTEVISKLSEDKQYSPDFLARFFYESILQSDHKKFIKQLHSHSNQHLEHEENKAQSANIKICVVPGMFYKEHPETGADGALALEIAEKFGFETCLIPIQSGGSVMTNSAIIDATLKEEKHPNIWLVSISKGSSDVRHFLQHHLQQHLQRKLQSDLQKSDVNTNIKGWINVAGIPKGLPYADYRLSTPFKRLVLRLLSLVFPFDYQALLELKSDHPFWQKRNWASLTSSMEMIHLVPIPHSAHLQGFLSKKYHKTLQLSGPNDGLVPLTDTLDLPGKIYPLWACDHFMRTPDMSAILYQLFNYISSHKQTNSPKRTNSREQS